ncbi:MAG: hypothetical protein EOO91_12960 [Pedobacter sp.]|nr:MAG: hypothetical protein EOO91_12960 [Pedobacter sp.]
MGLFDFFKPRSSFENEFYKIDGLSPLNAKVIEFNPNVTMDTILQLLSLLHQNRIAFSFYDALYPSVSDTGTYFDYQPTKNETAITFLMTLGNHGWSGGIYEISENTVATQIFNLIYQNHLQVISIDKVRLFTHHPLKDVAQNLKQNELICGLHTTEA